MKKKNNKFDKALGYSYRLLSYRPRSKKELSFRLKLKKFDKITVKKVIQRLEELDYIDDEEFAKFWIRMRLSAKPCGVSLLCYELRDKGVSQDIIDSVIKEQTKDYDEKKVALDLAIQQKDRLKNKDLTTAKRRIFGYLKRRGFSYSDIYDAINGIFKK